MSHGNLPFKLPPFSYPAYKYARHMEVLFKSCQEDKELFDSHQYFLQWAWSFKEKVANRVATYHAFNQ